MKSEVKIVLVGDEKVGKTSIITALVSETFQEKVAPVIPVVTFPPDTNQDKVTIHIVDTSSRPADWPNVEEEIKAADCLALIYDLDRIDTFNRITTFWLPQLRTLRAGKPSAPIILVGNKFDKRGDMSEWKQVFAPIMKEFTEVESCVVCSAKTILNIHEVFYFAQKAVLYPAAPLYNPQEHKLKSECVTALKRIFRLCDRDKDNALNDQELNEFQLKCFGVPLQHEEIEGVKKVVRENAPEGITERGLNLVGFLFLHHLFIQRANLNTTWTVLRKFNYGDDLNIREDFLNPEIGIQPGQTCELSSSGYQFFTDLFKHFDKDEDGALSQSELNDLFEISPGQPWGKNFPNQTVVNKEGNITLQGWIAQWSMTTLLDFKITLRYLAYLGFENPSQAITVTRGRRGDVKKKKITRNVFQAFVFGAPGSGKSSFLHAFIGKDLKTDQKESIGALSVVNASYIDGKEKYLVLREFASDSDIVRSPEKMEDCDEVIMLYDIHDSKSFSHVAELHKEISNFQYDNPVVYFSTKSDLPLVQQNSKYDNPQDFTKSMGVEAPKPISIKKGVDPDFFNSLLNPIFAQESGSNRWMIFVGIGLVAFVAGGVLYWKYRK